MIEVKNLVKQYESFKAVDDISFEVNKGDILGFLGPNGAGKSTTMKILSCFILPTSGRAKVGGVEVTENSLEVRRVIGYLPESAPSYKDMTVKEFLEFVAEIRNFYGSAKKSAVEHALEKTFLTEVKNQTIETLSKGFRQRVGFAQALIHDPPILILDEPTDGLDPNQKYEVRKMILNMSKDKAIILSTHILEEMEAVCNRTIIINKGKIVVDSTPSQLLEQSKYHRAVQIEFSEENSEIDSLMGRLKDEFEILLEDKTCTIFGNQNESPFDKVREATMAMNDKIASIHILKGRFDEVFRNLTSN